MLFIETLCHFLEDFMVEMFKNKMSKKPNLFKIKMTKC